MVVTNFNFMFLIQSCSSVSENFFVVKGANLILPKQSTFSIRNVQVLKMYGGMVFY